jgi:hydrogenase-4 component B
MTGMELLLLAFGVFLFGAVITALLGRWTILNGWVAFLFGLIGNLLTIVAALSFLVGEGGEAPSSYSLFNIPISTIFYIDRLGALFILIISFISIFSLLYSIRYMEIYKRNTALYYPFLLLFILGMIGVASVRNMFIFLLFWEFMTLTSYLLVIYETELPENLLAGFRYFFWSHLAAGCIMISTALFFVQTNSFDFAAFKEAIPTIAKEHPAILHSILALFLIGFGIKAGMFPFGNFWLPDAHPAAPSPVSALLSGVMIKTGVYGILRFFLWMLPPSDISNIWGSIIAVFGVLSLTFGTLSALEQVDTKRLLAFSSIGQMGYILLGIGVGLALLPKDTAFAYLAILAGLFHLTNHAVFKALLFLTAGSILYKKGTRDLAKMGGFISSMPWTFFAVVMGALAIGGLPPFSGFVSKWLIVFSSTLSAKMHYEFPIWAMAALFAGGLSIAYTLKYIGAAFLGLRKEEKVDDVPLTMQIPQFVLAILCLLMGVFAVFPLQLIHFSLQGSIANLPSYSQLLGSGLSITPQVKNLAVAIWNPLLILLSLAILSVIFYEFIRGARKETVIWLGGTMPEEKDLIYRPSGFFLTLRRGMWSNIPSIPLPRIERLGRLSVAPGEDVYEPLIRLGQRFIERLRKSHSGLLQTYILWQMLGLAIVILLIYVFK